MEILDIIILILNVILIFIPFFLFFIYIKSGLFNNYPCYNIIILSFIIFIDNILRIISTKNFPEVIKYIQAFLLTFLDKVFLTTITSQAYLIYLGVVKTKCYFKNEKLIFYLVLFITIFIDLLITIIFFAISSEITNYGDGQYKGNKYFYYKGDEKKKIIDIIFNSFFLLINTYSVFILIFYMMKKKNDASLGLIEDLDYGHHYTRIILMFITNSAVFIESYLIIFGIIPIKDIDLIYLTTCLFVDLYYTINKIIIKKTLNIFCQKYYNKKYGEMSRTDSDISQESGEKKRNHLSDEFL